MGNLITKAGLQQGDIIIITRFGTPVTDVHAEQLNKPVIVKEIREDGIVVLPMKGPDAFVMFYSDEWKHA